MSLDITVGVLGGGQLGRMMAESGHKIGLRLAILDPHGSMSPAGKVAELSIEGSYNDKNKIKDLISVSDIITIEIEHVNVNALLELQTMNPDIIIRPDPLGIQVIQDKYKQKQCMSKSNIPLGDFMDLIIYDENEDENEKSLLEIVNKFGYPLMVKNKWNAYDGKGNAVVNNLTEFQQSIDDLRGSGNNNNSNDKDSRDCSGLYVEKWVPYTKELAVMVVSHKLNCNYNINVSHNNDNDNNNDDNDNNNNHNKNKNNNSSSNSMRLYDRGIELLCYPVVETHQNCSICHSVIAPAFIPPHVQDMCYSIAMNAVAALPGHHNIGIFGVELFLLDDETVLFNEIAPRPHNSGHYTQESCYCDQFEAHLRAVCDLPIDCHALQMKVNHSCMINVLGTGVDSTTNEIITNAMKSGYAGVHCYSKEGSKLGRKMAHFTVTGDDVNEIKSKLELISSHDSGNGHSVIDINKIFHNLYDGDLFNTIEVGVIMGSDSDLPTMKDACIMLDKFNIKYECTIVSAHRTPTRMYAYAQKARDRGIRVIIAGAGGAAHLPGMVASLTTLPVIGVPIMTNAFQGNDSLLSIVQMPRGVPVATVAIGNATNAALLAVRILSSSHNNKRGRELMLSLDKFMFQQENEVFQKAERLESEGYSKYLR